MTAPATSSILPASHLDLFDKKAIAHLALAPKAGSVLVNPVWCERRDGQVLINSAGGRLKDRVMRRGRRATLCLSDPENPYRYLEIRGPVTEIGTDGAEEDIDRLARKYLDVESYPNRREGEVRVTYRIAPEKVIAFPPE